MNNNNLNTIAEKLNTISKFLAKRDIPNLNKTELTKKYNIEQAYLLILFGASILYGCQQAAKAFDEGVAKRMMIVGGAGHTTDTLRKAMRSKYPTLETSDKTEAELIAYYL